MLITFLQALQMLTFSVNAAKTAGLLWTHVYSLVEGVVAGRSQIPLHISKGCSYFLQGPLVLRHRVLTAASGSAGSQWRPWDSPRGAVKLWGKARLSLHESTEPCPRDGWLEVRCLPHKSLCVCERTVTEICRSWHLIYSLVNSSLTGPQQTELLDTREPFVLSFVVQLFAFKHTRKHNTVMALLISLIFF